ncbi:MAG: hypothetical protein HOP11_10510 [Saprospiraceae bacterium]|nr:hypothetical protein [Saprospiraceae bacterium]
MNKDLIVNSVRIIILILFQVLILRDINFEQNTSKYFNIIIYQLGIMLLPLNLPTFIVFLVAFFSGLIVDSFYGSIGVHASACLWMAAIRTFVLKLLEPKSGYAITQKPNSNHLGMVWFLQYSAILCFVYLFIYFTLDEFTWVYIGTIMLKTICSFAISIVLIFLIQLLINFKD